MIIHKDSNGVETTARILLDDGTNIEGHLYEISLGANRADNPPPLVFQRGGVATFGVNGITSEALLAVLIHRTAFLQKQFPCKENERALAGMEDALAWFESRTYRRQVRCVEGKDVA